MHENVIMDHFTVACLVACPLNESEAGGDLVLIETSLLFYVNGAVILLISRNLHQKSSEVSKKKNELTSCLIFIQRPGN